MAEGVERWSETWTALICPNCGGISDGPMDHPKTCQGLAKCERDFPQPIEVVPKQEAEQQIDQARNQERQRIQETLEKLRDEAGYGVLRRSGVIEAIKTVAALDTLDPSGEETDSRRFETLTGRELVEVARAELKHRGDPSGEQGEEKTRPPGVTSCPTCEGNSAQIAYIQRLEASVCTCPERGRSPRCPVHAVSATDTSKEGECERGKVAPVLEEESGENVGG